MANGVNRIFNVMKQTSEETSTKPSIVAFLTVKSINPLILERDDRLEITEEFCIFSDTINKSKIAIGDKLTAFTFNQGQLYFIQQNSNKPFDTTKSVIISPTEPTTGEEVWFKKTSTGKNIFYKNENEVYEKFFEHVKLYEGNIYEQDSVTLDVPVSDFRFLLCRIGSTNSYVVVPVIPGNANLRGSNAEVSLSFRIYSISATYNVSNNTFKLYFATGIEINNGVITMLNSLKITEIWGCY